ncbi:MAG: endonuclease/exonuclease/phosphatase family protein [Alphaproteobacteria bacterium]|nr:endonuclease/exonuclease/phosphatase family protein [Alphaproteobacteria bacterium]
MSRLRIATFNLENLDEDNPDMAPLAVRIEALQPQLQRLEADVLCLQEVNAQDGRGRQRTLQALDRLLSDTAYAEYARAVTTNDKGDNLRDVQNLVILSRLPIQDSRQLLNELVPEPVYRLTTADPASDGAAPVRWDRPILHAAVTLADGRTLHVVNLHLRAPLPAFIPGQKHEAFVWKSVGGWAEGTFISEIKRAGQALEARLLVDRLFDADPQALIAVLGDLNCDGRDAPLKILRGEVEETGNAALAERALAPLELSLPMDRRFSVLHYGQKLMLDHILVSRRLLACFRRAEVHNELLTDELVAFFAGRRDADSYHAPVVAEFHFADG